tara:strand:+ start:333 stop:593 length:261 start_codon:yes stop_codon:yes gene_type:complete
MYSLEVVIYILAGLFIIGNTLLFLALVLKVEEEEERRAAAKKNYDYPKKAKKKKKSKMRRIDHQNGNTSYVAPDYDALEDIVIEEI